MKTALNVKYPVSPIILVIDDDIQLVKYLSSLLEYEGYRVCTAYNGKEGLMKYFQCKPNLIITDIIMPEKEGLEFIIELRKEDQTIPIIAMSGGNNGYGGDYLRMGKTFGANAILNKPFEPEIILATVNELISTSESSV